jgi:hypothetical protein
MFAVKYCTRLKSTNPSSISMFMFVSCGLWVGVFVPSCGCVRFWLCPSSLISILLQFNKGAYINY